MKTNEKVKICLPLISENERDLYREIDYCLNEKPDILEWRLDYYKDYQDIDGIIKILSYIGSKDKQMPIILTLRSYKEGGYRPIEDKERLNIIKEIIKTGLIAYIDIEMYLGHKIEDVRLLAKENQVKTILSYHNFKETPDEEEILEKFKEGKQLKGDIVKLALRANEIKDILKLLNCGFKIKNQIDRPIILMGMGDLGRVTRTNPEFFGSAIVYAGGLNKSAPGQVSIGELRRKK